MTSTRTTISAPSTRASSRSDRAAVCAAPRQDAPAWTAAHVHPTVFALEREYLRRRLSDLQRRVLSAYLRSRVLVIVEKDAMQHAAIDEALRHLHAYLKKDTHIIYSRAAPVPARHKGVRYHVSYRVDSIRGCNPGAVVYDNPDHWGTSYPRRPRCHPGMYVTPGYWLEPREPPGQKKVHFTKAQSAVLPFVYGPVRLVMHTTLKPRKRVTPFRSYIARIKPWILAGEMPGYRIIDLAAGTDYRGRPRRRQPPPGGLSKLTKLLELSRLLDLADSPGATGLLPPLLPTAHIPQPASAAILI